MDSILLLNAKYSREVYWMLKIKKQIGIWRYCIMRLDGFGLFVEDMAKMIRFYRDVLGFEIKEAEDTSNVLKLRTCISAYAP